MAGSIPDELQELLGEEENATGSRSCAACWNVSSLRFFSRGKKPYDSPYRSLAGNIPPEHDLWHLLKWGIRNVDCARSVKLWQAFKSEIKRHIHVHQIFHWLQALDVDFLRGLLTGFRKALCNTYRLVN